MLQNLVVKNFAIIDDLVIDFFAGMTVITGDSGSGKSIIINALNFTLGARADKSILKMGEKRAQVIAKFIVQDENIINFLTQHQLNENNICILRRIITINGSSKAFINDIPVSLSLLQQLAVLLIDIFAQNQHQLLLNQQYQLQIFDSYGKTLELSNKIANIVEDINKLSNKIAIIENNATNNKQQFDFLEFQLQELTDSNLEFDELQNIEEKYKIANNAQNLIGDISTAMECINNENILSLLNKANGLLESSYKIDPKLQTAIEILASAKINLSECSYELNNYLNSYNTNSENIDELTIRLSNLNNLARKHNCQVAKLITVRDKIKTRMIAMNKIDDDMVGLYAEKSKLELQYQKLGQKLSLQRERTQIKLNKNVSKVINELGMPDSKFKAKLIPIDKINKYGNESVEFLVKINLGTNFNSLKKTASGGELSRIFLALAVVTTDNTYTPSLMFDEVDVGISGKVASIVGEKLHQLAKKYQVICITHLAQVAAKADKHLLISKQQTNNATTTSINYLSTKDRVKELARILGGKNMSIKTYALAQEMIDG